MLLYQLYFAICTGFGITAIAQLIKVDCHPDPNPTQDNCQARGCIYLQSNVTNEPWCYFDNSSSNFAGYDLIQTLQNTSTDFKGVLQRRNSPSLFGGDKSSISIEIKYADNYLLINIDDATTKLQNSPYFKNNRLTDQSDLDVQIQNQPFGVKVSRKSSGQTIFDTTGIPGLTYADQFVSLTTRTASSNIYGFGEQVHQNLKQNMNWIKWGMFARDEGSTGSNDNLYGVHPFYLCVETDGAAHGIFFANLHAQNVELAPYPSITYRAIGGSLSFYIFSGPTPDRVIQQYTSLIGFPLLPSYWSLGFHLCRYGYRDITEVQNVLKRNQQAGIPQDIQWIDIDYMDSYKDFTYDATNFNTLPQFAQNLHSQNLKLVLITDAAIAANPPTSYPPLTEGIVANVFIKDGRNLSQFLEGSVWPGDSYFPDFTHPNATQWWVNQMQTFNNVVNFDGIWLDMNEPSNQVTGSLTGCENNTWNNPPFVPLNDQNIYSRTICMDAVQHAGRHYDVHSTFGFFESLATNKALQNLFPAKRPFVLSRSTMPGSGTVTAHWTGDNQSKWPDMKWSIITVLEFNLFGIPFTGADICGFGSVADEDMCTRWIQLGAFYPFSRSHNNLFMPAQDPAVWSSQSVQSSKNVLTIRYKFLPYLYTLFYEAHTTGSTVMRPLLFEFPKDQTTLDIDDQFLWGAGLMIVPVLTALTSSRSAYFPAGRWFDLNSALEISNSQQGQGLTLQIGQYEIGLFVRGGATLPWQQPSQTTVDSRKNSLGLLVALDNNQRSYGSLYWDDGESQNTTQYSMFSFNTTFKANQFGKLVIVRKTGNYIDTINMNTIQIYGLISEPTGVTVNGVSLESSHIKYDFNVMTLTDLNLKIFTSPDAIQIIWNYF